MNLLRGIESGCTFRRSRCHHGGRINFLETTGQSKIADKGVVLVVRYEDVTWLDFSMENCWVGGMEVLGPSSSTQSLQVLS